MNGHLERGITPRTYLPLLLAPYGIRPGAWSNPSNDFQDKTGGPFMGIFLPPYCWWRKFCTTWGAYNKTLVNHGFFLPSQLVNPGFLKLPSTVPRPEINPYGPSRSPPSGMWVNSTGSIDKKPQPKSKILNSSPSTNVADFVGEWPMGQWSFLVPLIGGRYHMITQLAIYKWYISGIYYILLIGGLYGTYHLLREQETAIQWERGG